LSSNRLTVEGVAIGSVPVPYRLDCALATVAGFVATQVEVSARGDGRQRSLTLTRLSSRGWTAETQSVGDDVAGRLPGDRAPDQAIRRGERRLNVRELNVSTLVTLDGVLEDPGGAEQTENGGWSLPFFDEEAEQCLRAVGRERRLPVRPQDGIGQPREIAAAAVWLCSDEASCLTGATLVLDGGKLAGTPHPSQRPEASRSESEPQRRRDRGGRDASKCLWPAGRGPSDCGAVGYGELSLRGGAVRL